MTKDEFEIDSYLGSTHWKLRREDL